jgi:cytochrome c553
MFEKTEPLMPTQKNSSIAAARELHAAAFRAPKRRALKALQSRCFGVALAVVALGCDYKAPKEQATASGEEIFQLCAQCHGPAGDGRQKFNAPSIAGLPQWYLEAQLKKFRTGARGTHPADITGMQMRPMALSFHNDGDLKAVAAYVSSMSRPASTPMVSGGNAANGQTAYAVCAACHGADGAGNELVKAPPLKRASDWYLLRQLEKFKEGHRGTNPRDIEGAQMRPMAVALADAQAMKDVVAHIATLK